MMSRRLRELAVPLAIYLAIALVLPIVNGAAGRADFAHHAAWVLLGVGAVAGAILLVGFSVDMILAGARRIANTRAAHRVSHGGHE